MVKRQTAPDTANFKYKCKNPEVATSGFLHFATKRFTPTAITFMVEMSSASTKYIVLFDGVCNLCNGMVQFIIKRDKKKQFLFGSLQGKTGQEYLHKYNLPVNTFNSFMLIEGDKLYTRSTGALRMMKHLGGGWQLLYAFIIIPRFIRDAVYRLIAMNRYNWFGKKDQCRVPTAEERERFLD